MQFSYDPLPGSFRSHASRLDWRYSIVDSQTSGMTSKSQKNVEFTIVSKVREGKGIQVNQPQCDRFLQLLSMRSARPWYRTSSMEMKVLGRMIFQICWQMWSSILIKTVDKIEAVLQEHGSLEMEWNLFVSNSEVVNDMDSSFSFTRAPICQSNSLKTTFLIRSTRRPRYILSCRNAHSEMIASLLLFWHVCSKSPAKYTDKPDYSQRKVPNLWKFAQWLSPKVHLMLSWSFLYRRCTKVTPKLV